MLQSAAPQLQSLHQSIGFLLCIWLLLVAWCSLTDASRVPDSCTDIFNGMYPQELCCDPRYRQHCFEGCKDVPGGCHSGIAAACCNNYSLPLEWPLEERGALLNEHWSCLRSLKKATHQVALGLAAERVLLVRNWVAVHFQITSGVGDISSVCERLVRGQVTELDAYTLALANVAHRFATRTQNATQAPALFEAFAQAAPRVLMQTWEAVLTTCRAVPPGSSPGLAQGDELIEMEALKTSEELLRNAAHDFKSWFSVAAHYIVGMKSHWGTPAPIFRVLEGPCCTCQDVIAALIGQGLLGPTPTEDQSSLKVRQKASWNYFSDAVGMMGSSSILLLEVGVHFGMTPHFLLPRVPELFYVGMDPYLPYAQVKEYTVDVEYLDRARTTANEILLGYQDRAVLRRMSSRDAELVTSVPNASFDVVFIDGDHSREAVVDDFNIWWPKVRCGGFFIGDDLHLLAISRVVWEWFAGQVVYVNGKTFVVPHCNCASAQVGRLCSMQIEMESRAFLKL